MKLGGTGTVCSATITSGLYCSTGFRQLPFVSGTTAPDAYNGQNVSYFPYHVPIQRIWQYNLSVQRQFGPNLGVSVAYVGSHGFDLIGPGDLNAVPISHVSSNDAVIPPEPELWEYCHLWPCCRMVFPTTTPSRLSIDKRMSSGLSFNFNYTLVAVFV